MDFRTIQQTQCYDPTAILSNLNRLTSFSSTGAARAHSDTTEVLYGEVEGNGSPWAEDVRRSKTDLPLHYLCWQMFLIWSDRKVETLLLDVRDVLVLGMLGGS